MPLLACSVTGDFCSFDLASRGTALTLRLRDSFRPLTCGLSRKSPAVPPQRSHRHIVPADLSQSPFSGGSFCRRIAAVVCFCLPAGVSHPAHLPAGFHSHRRNVLFRPLTCGLSRKSQRFLHNARIGILSPRIYHSLQKCIVPAAFML